jgi:hypothetical protein
MHWALNRHVTDDELECYALNGLEEPELDQVEEHVWMCEQCQQALSAEQAYTEGMRMAARRLRQASATRSWRFLPVPAWAVALAVLLVLAAMWRVSYHPAAVPQALVVLESMRGADGPVNSTAAGRAFTLALDLTELPPLGRYELEIVDETGQEVFHSSVAGGSNEVRAIVPRGLASGMHYVRLYGTKRELLREYGLHVGAR